jgi:hypothetical protein
MFKRFISLSLVLSLALSATPKNVLAATYTALVDVQAENTQVMTGTDKLELFSFTVSPYNSESGALELKSFILECSNADTFKNIWVMRNYDQYDQLRYNNALETNRMLFSLKDELVVSTGSKTFTVYASLTNTNSSYTAQCQLKSFNINSLLSKTSLSANQIDLNNNYKSTVTVEGTAVDSSDNEDNEEDSDTSVNSQDRIILTNNPVATTVGESPSSTTPAQFFDVNVYTSYSSSIDWMRTNGIANGYQDGSFRPNECVNRVEFLKLLFETNNTPLTSYYGPLFWDTNQVSWYSDYLGTALSKGVINGYPDASFKPYNCVNRAEAIKMATIEFYGHVQTPSVINFTPPKDIEQNTWYSNYFNFAFNRQLLGTLHMLIDQNGAYYLPNQAMLRGEVAYMLHNMYLDSKVAYYQYPY